MVNLSPSKTHHVCCDASTVNVPDKVSFFYKSSVHHDPGKARVHVDFTLQIKGIPLNYWGYWRSRVRYWLEEKGNDLSRESGFEYYKNGFRLSLTEAEKFIQTEYKIKSILNSPSDEELLEKYKNMEIKNEGPASEC